MARKAIPKATQDEVLVKSRRRCSICFGLNRDTNLKAGQIAHLDHDNTNCNEDNLAFLCLEHHDEYDSKTKQRKNLTIGEVKAFRNELYDAIGKAFTLEVHFGSVTVPAADPYAGVFVRTDSGSNSAEIALTPVRDTMEGYPQYHVGGEALWGAHREYGPNLGELSIVAQMEEPGLIKHYEAKYNGETHSIRMIFDGDILVIEEKNYIGVYGMNVTFNGTYRRATGGST